MSNHTTITNLPEITNSILDESLTVNKRFIIDKEGNNISMSPDKLTEIRKIYYTAIKNGQNIDRIILDIFINRSGRFLLESIDYKEGKFFMNVRDLLNNKSLVYDFERDIKSFHNKRAHHLNNRGRGSKKYNKKTYSQNYYENNKEKYREYSSIYLNGTIEEKIAYRKKYNTNKAFAADIKKFESESVSNKSVWRISEMKTEEKNQEAKTEITDISSVNTNLLKRIFPELATNLSSNTMAQLITLLGSNLMNFRDENELQKMKQEIEVEEKILNEKKKMLDFCSI